MKLPTWLYREVDPGGRLSRWHGIICLGYATQTVHCCLMPFNLPIRILYYLWLWLKRPLRFFDSTYHAHYWLRQADTERRRARDSEYETSQLRLEVKVQRGRAKYWENLYRKDINADAKGQTHADIQDLPGQGG